MTKRLEGKVAMVVGAGSRGPGWGNGKAVAVLFAREGAEVFAVDANLAAVEETREIIESEGGVCSTFEADITKADRVHAMTEACIAQFGKIDVLHNNVGIAMPGGPVKISEADWELVFAVNCKALYLTCKHVLPHMVKVGRGSIVNISSIASLRYLGFAYAAYDASKAAVNGLTRSIAMEYAGRGIRANVVHVGMMDTPLAKDGIRAAGREVDEIYAGYSKKIPLGRMGTAWDTANAALFLASDESSYLTGVELPVDGGLICRTP